MLHDECCYGKICVLRWIWLGEAKLSRILEPFCNKPLKSVLIPRKACYNRALVLKYRLDFVQHHHKIPHQMVPNDPEPDTNCTANIVCYHSINCACLRADILYLADTQKSTLSTCHVVLFSIYVVEPPFRFRGCCFSLLIAICEQRLYFLSSFTPSLPVTASSKKK